MKIEAAVSVFGLVVAATSLAAPASAQVDLKAVQARVQKVLDEQSVLWNASFQVGFANAQGEFNVASGVKNHVTGERMGVDDMIPLGSTTKAFTAAAAVKMAERGVFSLDDKAHVYADRMLVPLNGSTLQDIWGGDATVNDITIRQLLHMSSGLQDYDDAALREYTEGNPGEDESPVDMFYQVNKTLLGAPGTMRAYSSVGFTLLGMVLAGADPRVSAWTELDQKSFMSDEQRLKWNRTSFPMMGRCTKYDVTPQWNVRLVPLGDGTDPNAKKAVFYDYSHTSCLNGWTCGNIAARASDVAGFFFELLTGKIVSQNMINEMCKFETFNTGWGTGIPYGLGLMHLETGDYEMIGHAGQDYASGAPTAGYNVKHKFGVVVAVNEIMGMNCTDPDAQQGMSYRLSCEVQNAIIDEISGHNATLRPCGGAPSENVDAAGGRVRRLTALRDRRLEQERTMAANLDHILSGRVLSDDDVAEAKCTGQPITAIPYLAIDKCLPFPTADAPQFYYKMSPPGVFGMLSFKQYAPTDKTCSGKEKTSPIRPKSCFPLPGQSIDIEFYYNATSKVALEVLYRAPSDVKACEWIA